jgi:hypothetical protein
LLLSLDDLIPKKQFIFLILPDGVQFAPSGQIIDVLPAAAKNTAGFAGIDDPVPDKGDEIFQGERDAVTVFIELPI